MNLSKKISLLILFCFGVSFSIAQQQKKENPGDRYRVVHWGIDDGLTDGTYNLAMLKDVSGFLWVGSRNGLNRFDGSKFKHYLPDKNKPGNIVGTYINNLIEDSLHNIWIGTNKGLSRYDIKADTFRNFLANDDLIVEPKARIIPIWATRNEVYCMEPDSTITSYDIHSFAKKTLGSLSGENTSGEQTNIHIRHSVFDARSNSIWMLYGPNNSPDAGLLQVSLSNGKSNHYSWPCYLNIPGHGHYSE